MLALLLSCTAPEDTAQPEDSVVETDSGETGETGETGDTGEPEGCTGEPKALFTPVEGDVVDLTTPMRDGTFTTIDEPGTLTFCPETYYSRLLIRADVHVEGLGDAPEDTILSAGEQGTILDVSGALLTASNLTLDRGAGLDVDHNSGGGGIYCEAEGHVLGEDLIFTNNFANDGPGMYVTSCTFDLSRAVFRDNYAEDDGGALTIWFSEGTLSDILFEDNEGLDGGAIAIFDSTVSATGLTIRNNTAHNFGGGVWSLGTELTLEDTVFEGNVNDGTNGGGLLIEDTATLTRVDFTGNDGVTGGGLFVYWDAVVTGTDCDFADNTPDDIWVADYEPEDYGHAIDAGEGYSFSCAGSEY